MPRRRFHFHPSAGLVPLAALLAAAAAPAGAAPQGDEPKAVVRNQVVVESGKTDSGVRVFFMGDDGHEVRIEPGHARRGYLGVGLLDLTPELRSFFGAPQDRGVLVSRVEVDSPAAAAGLAVGDVLTALDGEAIDSAGRATHRIGAHEQGDRVRLEIRRERAPRTLTAELTERSREQVDLGYAFWSCAPGEACGGAAAPGDGGATYRRVIPLAPEQLGEAMRELRRNLDSPEWKERMQRFQDGQEGYEERLRRLEERIRELEEQLDKQGGD